VSNDTTATVAGNLTADPEVGLPTSTAWPPRASPVALASRVQDSFAGEHPLVGRFAGGGLRFPQTPPSAKFR
jgi:hypothetical protein